MSRLKSEFKQYPVPPQYNKYKRFEMQFQKKRQGKSEKGCSKRLRKRLNIFSYFLLVSNKVTERMYSLMLLIDFVFLLVIPLQICLNLNADEGSDYIDLNFIQSLGKVSSHLYVTDIINAVLLVLFVISVIIIMRFDTRLTKIRLKSKGSHTFLCFIFLLIGRLFIQYILAIQIQAIQCAFVQGHCFEKTGLARLITNIVGMVLVVAFNQLNYAQIQCVFPDPRVPWAYAINKLNFFYRAQHIVLAIVIGLQNYLLTQVKFYVLLIPIIIIQTMQVWVVIYNRVAYSRMVDLCLVTRDVTIWTLSFFAIILAGTGIKPDISFIVLIILVMIINVPVIYFYKKNLQNCKAFQDKPKSDKDAHEIIYTLLFYSLSSDPLEDMQLRELYIKHLWECEDPVCLCQQGQLSEANAGIETIRYDKSQQSLTFSGETVQDQEEEQVDEEQELTDAKERTLMNNLVIQLAIKSFKQQFVSKKLVFQEIFIQTKFMKRVYTSFYDLLKIKRKCHSNQEKRIYQYLKILILKKTKDQEIKSKEEVFDVDQTMQVDTLLSEYKKMIEKTSLLVQRFWLGLSKTDFLIIDQIDVGVKIVDNYLEVKSLYESITKRKPDHKEAVQLSIHFNQDVMNFELEAQQALNQLKNIDQKLKITRQNQYMTSAEQLGILIVSISPAQRNKIIFCNKNVGEISGYIASQVCGRDINFLIPKIISQIHDQIIDRFIEQDHSRHLNSIVERVWLLRKDGTIEPVQLTIQTCVSDKLGICLVAFFDPSKEIVTENITYKVDKAYILLTNEQGFVTNVTSNFKKTYLAEDCITDEESKLNTEEFFEELNEFTTQELSQGVRTAMIVNFGCPAQTNNKFNKIKKWVVITVKEHTLLNNVLMKEVIFVEDSTQDEEQSHKNEDSSQTEVDTGRAGHTLEGQANNEAIEHLHFNDINDRDSSSSASASVSTTNELMLSKGVLDFRQIPQSLQNLRRAIFIFFAILIATSFSVLAVSLVSYDEFQNNSMAVNQAINLTNFLAEVRLAFRILIIETRSNDDYTNFSNFEYVQGKMELFYDQIRQSQNYLQSYQYTEGSELNELINSQILELEEFQTDGKITTQKTTFNTGLYQFVTKFQQFFSMEPRVFFHEFKDLITRQIPKGATQAQRDGYFIIINGKSNKMSLTRIREQEHHERSLAGGRGIREVLLGQGVCIHKHSFDNCGLLHLHHPSCLWDISSCDLCP